MEIYIRFDWAMKRLLRNKAIKNSHAKSFLCYNKKGNVKVQKLLHSLFSFYVSFAITLFAYVIMP